jgi:hypothetical protein
MFHLLNLNVFKMRTGAYPTVLHLRLLAMLLHHTPPAEKFMESYPCALAPFFHVYGYILHFPNWHPQSGVLSTLPNIQNMSSSWSSYQFSG